MNLASLIQQIDTLNAEINALRPIDAEQEGRVMQMLRLDWNYHSNAFEQQVLRLREQLAPYDA